MACGRPSSLRRIELLRNLVQQMFPRFRTTARLGIRPSVERDRSLVIALAGCVHRLDPRVRLDRRQKPAAVRSENRRPNVFADLEAILKVAALAEAEKSFLLARDCHVVFT